MKPFIITIIVIVVITVFLIAIFFPRGGDTDDGSVDDGDTDDGDTDDGSVGESGSQIPNYETLETRSEANNAEYYYYSSNCTWDDVPEDLHFQLGCQQLSEMPSIKHILDESLNTNTSVSIDGVEKDKLFEVLFFGIFGIWFFMQLDGQPNLCDLNKLDIILRGKILEYTHIIMNDKIVSTLFGEALKGMGQSSFVRVFDIQTNTLFTPKFKESVTSTVVDKHVYKTLCLDNDDSVSDVCNEQTLKHVIINILISDPSTEDFREVGLVGSVDFEGHPSLRLNEQTEQYMMILPGGETVEIILGIDFAVSYKLYELSDNVYIFRYEFNRNDILSSNDGILSSFESNTDVINMIERGDILILKEFVFSPELNKRMLVSMWNSTIKGDQCYNK